MVHDDLRPHSWCYLSFGWRMSKLCLEIIIWEQIESYLREVIYAAFRENHKSVVQIWCKGRRREEIKTGGNRHQNKEGRKLKAHLKRPRWEKVQSLHETCDGSESSLCRL